MTLIIKIMLIFAGFINVTTAFAIYQSSKFETDTGYAPHVFATVYAVVGLSLFWLAAQKILI